MTKSWEDWTKENLERNCNPNDILLALLGNDFSLEAVRELMGDEFPSHLTQSAQALLEQGAKVGDLVAIDEVHNKRESIVKIQRSLSRLSKKVRTIERRENISRDEFLEEYYATNKPVILCGLMNDWKAMKRWTPEYLKSVCGDQDIEIMAARESNFLYEIQDKAHRKIVKFSDYVDMVSDLQNESNDYYLTARNGFLDRPAARPLLEDFAPFSEYLTADCSQGKAFLWYGPKGTITALHHDHMNLLLSQVQGRKIVKLIPPDELDLVYNFFSVYSLVDMTDPDFEQFPKFQEATVSEVTLEAGEVLFIPVGWWHYVVATEPTISISFTNFVFPNEFDWYEPRPSLPQEWQNATSTTSV